MYDCIFCNKTFTRQSNLRRHYNCCNSIDNYKDIFNNLYTREYNSNHEKELNDKNLEITKLKIQIEQYEQKNIDIIKQYENEISRLMHLINNNKQVIHTTNNIVHNNTNTQNIGHKYVMNEFSPLKQQFIDEEMQGINLRNTNRPLEELSNHVNKSRIGLNFYVKDRSRKQIVYLDEESNESNDTTKLGEQIYRSIIDHVNDILYSEHKRSNKVYRKQIEQLSKNCTDTYNKIISDCIKFAKSPDRT